MPDQVDNVLRAFQPFPIDKGGSRASLPVLVLVVVTALSACGPNARPPQATLVPTPIATPEVRTTAETPRTATPIATPAVKVSPAVTRSTAVPQAMAPRTPRPTPAVADSPQLRQAVTRLDQLDRNVLAVADKFVAAFLGLGSKKVTLEQFCQTGDAAGPEMDQAVDELARFQPPTELRSVYDRYIAVAKKMREALGEQKQFCGTSDPSHNATYIRLIGDAVMESAYAKADLDDIALAIGMPIPRSTRVPTPPPTR